MLDTDAETPRDDPDDGLERRFTALFRNFAWPHGTLPEGREAAFLLAQLRAPAAARLLFCARSLSAYGWAAVGEGCSVALLGDPAEPNPADGALCAIEELTAEALTGRPSKIPLLARSLRAQARLIVTGEPPAFEAALMPPSSFSLLGRTQSPAGGSVQVWVRTPRANR